MLLVAAPFLFLGGLVEVFKSSSWALTYRALRGLESAALIEPGVEVVPAG